MDPVEWLVQLLEGLTTGATTPGQWRVASIGAVAVGLLLVGLGIYDRDWVVVMIGMVLAAAGALLLIVFPRSDRNQRE